MEFTGNYIREYDTPAEYQTARTGDYQEPWVSYTHGDERVDYNKRAGEGS
jgi:hypothetical protein